MCCYSAQRCRTCCSCGIRRSCCAKAAMIEPSPTPRLTCSARCTHMPRADIKRRHRERCRNALHCFWRVMRGGISTTNTELTEVVLSPTPHRIVCKNCTGIRTACGKLCDCATHIHLHRVPLSRTIHACLTPTTTSPAPHGAGTRENTHMFCASHHIRGRRNNAITKHPCAHRQQAFCQRRVI